MLNKQFEATYEHDHSSSLEVAKIRSDFFINTVENILWQKEERLALITLQCSYIPALYSLRHNNYLLLLVRNWTTQNTRFLSAFVHEELRIRIFGKYSRINACIRYAQNIDQKGHKSLVLCKR